MKWTNINKQIHAQSFGTRYFRVQTSFFKQKKKDRKDYPLNMFTVANKTDTFFFSKTQESCVSLYYEEKSRCFPSQQICQNDHDKFMSNQAFLFQQKQQHFIQSIIKYTTPTEPHTLPCFVSLVNTK